MNDQPPPEMVYPGRAVRVHRCKLCNKEVEFSVRLDWRTGKCRAVGECAGGHKFDESWNHGESPPAMPVHSPLEFQPFRRS